MRGKVLVVIGLAVLLFPAARRVTGAEGGATNPFRRQIQVQWKDTTLADCFDFLEELYFPDFGFALDTGCEDENVPSVDLRNTNIWTTLSVLNSLLENTEITLMAGARPVDDDLASELRQMPPDRWDEASRDLGPLTLVARRREGSAKAFCVYATRGPWGDIAVEELADALRKSWEMITGSTGELQYHPETALLVCAGTPIQVAVSDRVFAALRSTEELKSKLQKVKSLEAQNQKLADMVEELTKRNEALREQVEDLKNRVQEEERLEDEPQLLEPKD